MKPPQLDVPPEDKRRYKELVKLFRAETLTPEEHTELLSLTNQREVANARRIIKLIAMAREQNITIDELMNNLGLPAKPYA